MPRTNPEQDGQTEGTPPEELPYEEAVEEIEAIIERIESGEIGLEESLAQYERGTRLIRRCRAVLDRAEQRIEELDARASEAAADEARAARADACDPEDDDTPF